MSVVATLGLAWIVQVTTPASVHPIVVLLVLALIYVLVLVVLTFFIYWVNQLLAKILNRRSIQTITLPRAYMYASVVAFMPVALVALRSVRQGGFVDILLVLLFGGLACFYVWRRT